MAVKNREIGAGKGKRVSFVVPCNPLNLWYGRSNPCCILEAGSMMIHEWLVNEIRTYVKNQEKDKDRQINLFLIKDFIQTCRGFDCTDGEIETATRVIEDERGSKFQRGDAMGATMKIIRHREAIRAKGVMCSTSYVPVDPNRKVN